jgi:hypothetical protein
MLGGLIGWLPGGSTDITGSALTALLTIAGSVSGLVFAILYRFNSILESGS